MTRGARTPQAQIGDESGREGVYKRDAGDVTRGFARGIVAKRGLVTRCEGEWRRGTLVRARRRRSRRRTRRGPTCCRRGVKSRRRCAAVYVGYGRRRSGLCVFSVFSPCAAASPRFASRLYSCRKPNCCACCLRLPGADLHRWPAQLFCACSAWLLSSCWCSRRFRWRPFVRILVDVRWRRKKKRALTTNTFALPGILSSFRFVSLLLSGFLLGREMTVTYFPASHGSIQTDLVVLSICIASNASGSWHLKTLRLGFRV